MYDPVGVAGYVEWGTRLPRRIIGRAIHQDINERPLERITRLTMQAMARQLVEIGKTAA